MSCLLQILVQHCIFLLKNMRERFAFMKTIEQTQGFFPKQPATGSYPEPEQSNLHTFPYYTNIVHFPGQNSVYIFPTCALPNIYYFATLIIIRLFSLGVFTEEQKEKKTPWLLVRKRTISSERPPLVCDFSV
jgi:hypothetical protein